MISPAVISPTVIAPTVIAPTVIPRHPGRIRLNAAMIGRARLARSVLLALLAPLACGIGTVFAQSAASDAKEASPATAAYNRSFPAPPQSSVDADLADASRGFIAQLSDPVIRDARGEVVWDASAFDAVQGPAPASVNPSLWASARLTARHGLFKVSEGIYQVRGYDIDNMTLVASKTGWIVIDPTLTREVARAELALVDKHLGKRPIVALIYTHSHADHFGGSSAILDEADVRAGKVPVIAPDGFMENAIAENVLAGNAMGRRAQLMYGLPLPVGEKGMVGVGLGATLSKGTTGLIAPTDLIRKTGEERVVDGVRIVFEMAPGTEAPAEMLFYFPDLKALCVAEDVNKTMHNIYTLRGAKVRDALSWSKYDNQLLDLFPNAEVAFGSHTWPTWGMDRIRALIARQRDMYRFIHDRALYLANQGLKLQDLGNEPFYPQGLMADLSTRGYYGSLSHNLRAVYNFYLGFYDGNPATLNPYPLVETSRRYVAAIGGVDAVLAQGRKAFAQGDYRWTVELVNHAVMADPQNAEARLLQADALEQLGYQSENGPWRNEYLTAAQELRQGPKRLRATEASMDIQRSMSPSMVFDLLAVRLNHQKVDGLTIGINIAFSDTGENYALELSNSVLNNTPGRVLVHPDATLTLTHASFLKMTVDRVPLPKLIESGEAQLAGDPKALVALFSNVTPPDPMFNIVTPLAPR